MKPKDPPPGVGVDAQGFPVEDPTANVLGLVEAAMRRQDDLRNLVAAHAQAMAELRSAHEAEMRKSEAARINAIREVDINAVNRAAEVSLQQATTLAVQVATSAETLRTQVAAAASAAATALAAALEPIQKSIEDLRRAQYEAQGQKSQVGETRLNLGAVLGGLSVLLVLVFGIAALVLRK